MDDQVAGQAILFLLAIIAFVILVCALILAPLKLYGIYAEAKSTNALLTQTNTSLSSLVEQTLKTNGLVASLIDRMTHTNALVSTLVERAKP